MDVEATSGDRYNSRWLFTSVRQCATKKKEGRTQIFKRGSRLASIYPRRSHRDTTAYSAGGSEQGETKRRGQER